jgi:hypothetical protein
MTSQKWSLEMTANNDRGRTRAIAIGGAIVAAVVVAGLFAYAPKNHANSPADQQSTGQSNTQARDTTPRSDGAATHTTSGVPDGGAGSSGTRSSAGPSSATEGKDGESLANSGSAARTGERR